MLEGFDAILRVKVPEQVYDTFRKHAKAGSEKQAAWNKMWKAGPISLSLSLLSQPAPADMT